MRSWLLNRHEGFWLHALQMQETHGAEAPNLRRIHLASRSEATSDHSDEFRLPGRSAEERSPAALSLSGKNSMPSTDPRARPAIRNVTAVGRSYCGRVGILFGIDLKTCLGMDLWPPDAGVRQLEATAEN